MTEGITAISTALIPKPQLASRSTPLPWEARAYRVTGGGGEKVFLLSLLAEINEHVIGSVALHNKAIVNHFY